MLLSNQYRKFRFDDPIDFIRESRFLTPLVNILTPSPETKLASHLGQVGRILHKDWTKYDFIFS